MPYTKILSILGKIIGYGFITSIVGYSASIFILLATPNNKIIKLKGM